MKEILIAMITATLFRTIFFGLGICLAQLTFAQKVKRSPFAMPLTYEKHHVIDETSKSAIFDFLLKDEEKLLAKKESTIVVAHSVKGILEFERKLACRYNADTVFNGQVIKNAVNRNDIITYRIRYNVGDNIFTYKISGFKTQTGVTITEDNPKQIRLSDCASSEVRSLSEKMIAKSVVMKFKPLTRSK